MKLNICGFEEGHQVPWMALNKHSPVTSLTFEGAISLSETCLTYQTTILTTMLTTTCSCILLVIQYKQQCLIALHSSTGFPCHGTVLAIEGTSVWKLSFLFCISRNFYVYSTYFLYSYLPDDDRVAHAHYTREMNCYGF
jgi:hypothetical protein